MDLSFPGLQSQEKEMTPEEVGKRCAYALLNQIHAGGVVDSLHQVSLASPPLKHTSVIRTETADIEQNNFKVWKSGGYIVTWRWMSEVGPRVSFHAEIWCIIVSTIYIGG